MLVSSDCANEVNSAKKMDRSSNNNGADLSSMNWTLSDREKKLVDELGGKDD